MGEGLVWDEAKRRSNLYKHGLDFADACAVLESRYRLDLVRERAGEIRVQSYSYVMHRLRVLTVVHLEREGLTRIISYRPASRLETEVYREWLESEFDDA